MRLAIVGGKLQGTEAAYLAGEAGYEVVLIDRRAERPAAGLADECHVFDVTSDPVRARELFRSCDAVLPACEDDHTLAFLASFVPGIGVPLLFDLDAYTVTSSKLRSNALFERLDVPRPLAWPCGFPVVVKPAVGSGSAGVSVVFSEPALELVRAHLAAEGADAVVEEFVSGPSLSIEVLSLGGEAVTLLPTWLEFDAVLDCKRVVAPVDGEGGAATVGGGGEDSAKRGGDSTDTGAETTPGATAPDATAAAGADRVSAATMRGLDQAARRLAEGVALGGVMDVEVMVAPDGTPKVIEIDARLPSQTPAAVFHASDVNIVALLAETFAGGRPPAVDPRARRGAVYQHVLVENGRVEVLGEHVVGSAGPLRRCDGLYGADVVLTDLPDRGRAQRAPGAVQERWVAVLMTRGSTAAVARERATAAVERLADEHGLELVPERGPEQVGASGASDARGSAPMHAPDSAGDRQPRTARP